MKVSIHRYQDGERIGTTELTPAQFAHYMAMAQQPQGIVRLGALPHDLYDLDVEYQDSSPDTTVYMEEV